MTSYHKLISKQDAFNILDFCHDAMCVTDPESYKSLFLKFKKLLPFEHAFSYYMPLETFFATPNTKKLPPSRFHWFVELYPPGIIEEYYDKSLWMNDPIPAEFVRTMKPANWQISFKKGEDDSVERLVKDFRIIDGHTYGLMNPKLGSITAFSLAYEYSDNTDRIEKILEIITPHLCEAYKRSLGAEQINRIHLHTQLTKREVEIMNWIKLGKTSWEISVILNISERTVNFHTRNIVRKLDACNRTHAVAIACCAGLIEF